MATKNNKELISSLKLFEESIRKKVKDSKQKELKGSDINEIIASLDASEDIKTAIYQLIIDLAQKPEVKVDADKDHNKTSSEAIGIARKKATRQSQVDQEAA